jgi:hypothetical protein
MAVRLSDLTAGRSLPPGRFLVLISVRSWVDPRASAAGRFISTEKSNYLIGKRTRDLPACSIVPLFIFAAGTEVTYESQWPYLTWEAEMLISVLYKLCNESLYCLHDILRCWQNAALPYSWTFFHSALCILRVKRKKDEWCSLSALSSQTEYTWRWIDKLATVKTV